MPKYPFLSDEWLDEARRIYAEAETNGVLPVGSSIVPVRVNLIVTEAPFSLANLDAHVDTSAGRIEIGTGHVEGPDVTVSLDYVTARSLFVQGDAQAVLQAFLGGRIKVDGDLSKLLDPHSGIWPGAAPAAPADSAGAPAQGQVGQQDQAGQVGQQDQVGQVGQQDQVGQVGQQDQVGQVGQQGLAFSGHEALRMATRLQEITE